MTTPQKIALIALAIPFAALVFIPLGLILKDVVDSYRAGNLRLVLSLSVRNLFRQKRRSLLLGTAIGFGMMVLVIIGGFAAGLSDLMLNKVFAMMMGHMEVVMQEHSGVRASVIRDRERVVQVIQKNIPDVKEIRDNLSVFSRMIGNGKSDTLILIGIPVSNASEYEKQFIDYNMAAAKGDLWSLTNKGVCGIFEEKAKKLNVTVGDNINVRFSRIKGTMEARSYKVGVIFKDSSFFMNMTVYVDERDLKQALGFQPWETAGLQVMLHDSKKAEAHAAAIHRDLAGNPGILEGTFAGTPAKSFSLVGIREKERTNLLSRLQWVAGNPGELSNGIWITEALSRESGALPGSPVRFTYRSKYDGMKSIQATVTGVFAPKDDLFPKRAALLGEEKFYDRYFEGIPPAPTGEGLFYLKSNLAAAPFLIPEWNRLERTYDAYSQRAKFTKLASTKWKGQILDVRTLQETGTMAIKMEQALNTIAYSGVLIMFFIIVIGVVNALRMTIRERTREIGTIRSMGMERREVRLLFLMESVALSAFACLAGFLGALVVMGLIGAFKWSDAGIWSMLLNNGHIHFLLKPANLLINLTLIIGITALTAFFPARQAAKLPPADALRHTAS